MGKSSQLKEYQHAQRREEVGCVFNVEHESRTMPTWVRALLHSGKDNKENILYCLKGANHASNYQRAQRHEGKKKKKCRSHFHSNI